MFSFFWCLHLVQKKERNKTHAWIKRSESRKEKKMKQEKFSLIFFSRLSRVFFLFYFCFLSPLAGRVWGTECHLFLFLSLDFFSLFLDSLFFCILFFAKERTMKKRTKKIDEKIDDGKRRIKNFPFSVFVFFLLFSFVLLPLKTGISSKRGRRER